MPHFKDSNNKIYFLSDADVVAGWTAKLPPGSASITDAEAEALRPKPDPNAVPLVVTRRQALLALLAAGKLDEVELIVQNSPRAVQIAWESAGTFERDNPLIGSLGSQAGLSSDDIDHLFEQAAKL